MRLPSPLLEALERSKQRAIEEFGAPLAFGACGHRVVLPSGNASEWKYSPNGVTVEALQAALQVLYMGAGQLAQIFPWFGRLVDATGFVAFASSDTHEQINLANQWDEITDYTVGGVVEGAQWVVVAPTGSNLFLTNIASPMSFLATALLTVQGSFLASTKTHGPDATKYLNSTSDFDEGVVGVAMGSTLEVNWTFSLGIGA